MVTALCIALLLRCQFPLAFDYLPPMVIFHSLWSHVLPYMRSSLSLLFINARYTHILNSLSQNAQFSHNPYPHEGYPTLTGSSDEERHVFWGLPFRKPWPPPFTIHGPRGKRRVSHQLHLERFPPLTDLQEPQEPWTSLV